MSQDDADTRPMTINHTDEPVLWDARDVARYLKASRSWVYHQAEAGQLPSIRIGGLLRFDPVTIKRFVQTSRAS